MVKTHFFRLWSVSGRQACWKNLTSWVLYRSFQKSAYFDIYPHESSKTGVPKVAVGLPFETGSCHMAKSTVICHAWGKLQTASFRGPHPLFSRKTHKRRELYSNFFVQQESAFVRWFGCLFRENDGKRPVSKANIMLEIHWNLDFALDSRCSTKMSTFGNFELQTWDFASPHPLNIAKSASFGRWELKLFCPAKISFCPAVRSNIWQKDAKNVLFWS